MDSHQDPGPEQLAQVLGAFRPVAPGAGMKERIRMASAAAQTREPSGIRSALRWLALPPALRLVGGALAVLALSAMLAPRFMKSLEPAWGNGGMAALDGVPDSAEIEEETLWGAGEVAGIVDTGDGQPMWKLRYETIRRTVWSDEQGATRLIFEPEERIVFVPVSYN